MWRISHKLTAISFYVPPGNDMLRDLYVQIIILHKEKKKRTLIITLLIMDVIQL